jgi:hypothetical protein
VSAPSAISAPPPATAIKRRIDSFELMINTISQTTGRPQAVAGFPTQLAAHTQPVDRPRCGGS